MAAGHADAAHVLGPSAPGGEELAARAAPRAGPAGAPEHVERAGDLAPSVAVGAVDLDVDARTRAVVVAPGADGLPVVRGGAVLGHRRLAEHARVAGPRAERALEVEVGLGGDQPLGQRRGLREEVPVVAGQPAGHAHLLELLDRRHDVEQRQPFDPLRMVEREPVGHARPAVVPREAEPLEAELAHQRDHLPRHPPLRVRLPPHVPLHRF